MDIRIIIGTVYFINHYFAKMSVANVLSLPMRRYIFKHKDHKLFIYRKINSKPCGYILFREVHAKGAKFAPFKTIIPVFLAYGFETLRELYFS